MTNCASQHPPNSTSPWSVWNQKQIFARIKNRILQIKNRCNNMFWLSSDPGGNIESLIFNFSRKLTLNLLRQCWRHLICWYNIQMKKWDGSKVEMNCWLEWKVGVIKMSWWCISLQKVYFCICIISICVIWKVGMEIPGEIKMSWWCQVQRQCLCLRPLSTDWSSRANRWIQYKYN